MSQNSFLVNGVQCSVEDEDGELMIDLRPAGFLERSIPHELLDHPKIKKILLFHKSVPTILESTVDKLDRSLSIEVFDECSDNNPFKKFQFSKYLWKTCQIDSNQHGIIRLDIRCDALTRELVFSPRKKKLRQLKLRGYRRDVLARCNRAITEDLEELVIASGEPGPNITVNACPYRYARKNVESFPETTFQGVTLETSQTKITMLQDSSESKSISLEGVTNLKRFLLSANGKQILPTGMVQLHNLQELCIFDNPIGDHFQSSCFPRNLRKLILFNCGLKAFPFAITQLKDLEVLELYFNNFHNQVLTLSGLAKLKRLVIFSCELNTYPKGLENCINLEYLDLSNNESLGQNSFTITQFKNLKFLVMDSCGLKHVPEGFENCINLEDLDLSGNESLGQNPFKITQFKSLKNLVMGACGLKRVPEGLKNCINLEHLDLSWNKSLGQNPFKITQFKSLKNLVMDACGLKHVPKGLDNCINLEYLDLSHNESLGQNPFTIPQFKNLKKLVMLGCGLKDVPEGLENCINLEILDLSHNESLGQNPFTIPQFKNLKDLAMTSCGLKDVPEGLEDCINLEYLDLCGNESLGQNPFKIPQLKNLKKLDMTVCDLKHVPEGLENCINLEDLHLGHNESLGQNPFTIPQFKNLKILVMRRCGLKHVPEGLENCINLEDLDLSGNESLGEEKCYIPMLEKLTRLDLSNCCFRFVPNDVVELPSLQYLDMSSNRLKELPESFTNLIEKKVKLQLTGNVLGKPPQVICKDGNAILNYFKSIAKFGEAHSKRLRVLVFGNSGAGKTSLVNGLLMGESMLTNEIERTEGIEIRKWYPDPANQDLELEIWDFGGHMEYQSVSHYFLEEHSLFLLVVDLSKYEKTGESYHENVGKWIDEVKSIVLRPVVMVAATKSDLFFYLSVREDRCRHMLEKIGEQERQDMKSIKSDLEKLPENDYTNAGRRKKLDILITKRPVLPKDIISAFSKKKGSSNEDTYVVTVSAGPFNIFKTTKGKWLNTFLLSQELVQTGSNTNHFPHLKTTLPLLWVEIEKSLLTLKEEMKNKVGPKYLSFDELEKRLCQQLQKFKEDVNKKDTLNMVLSYLVKLGKVLRFERVEQLSHFIFPDPQWLIMLVKKIVHHDLQTRLEFKEDFKACDMDAKRFENEKQDLIHKGLLSESLLRCIWFDAVPEKADFKKLVPLLYHFDVGYRMTRKEAEFKGKEISKNYILIPALMSESKPVGIGRLWPTIASENEFETKSEYSFLSTLPVGLFERQMVRCHHGSDFMYHWKNGFYGVTNYEEPDEVKFYVTKQKETIDFTIRIKNNGPTIILWKVVLHLHQIFVNMVEELWPELRYVIYNKCPECNECHHELDFERLLEAPRSYSRNVFCEAFGPFRPVKVNKELVFPPQGVIEEFKRNKDSRGGIRTDARTSRDASTSADALLGESSQIMVRHIPYLVREKICRLLNIKTDGRDFRTLAGILSMEVSDMQSLGQKDDPTDEVLKWWETKNSATLQRFREVLREMQRDDILQILDEYQSGSRTLDPPSKRQKIC